MEKDRIIKKDVSQQEVIDYFQQQLSRTGFVLIYINIIFDADSNNKKCVLEAHNQW